VTDKIAIIGFGNIAKAIITPLLDKKIINPKDVFCLVNSKKSLESIKKNYKYKSCNKNFFHKTYLIFSISFILDKALSNSAIFSLKAKFEIE